MAGDERDDEAGPVEDPDRAAILARRKRFVALALTGLATGAGCKRNEPQPCLSIAAPDEGGPGTTGPGEDTGTTDAGNEPFVEEPGVPVSDEGELAEGGDETDTGGPSQPPPEPCLKVAPPPKPKPKPKPCLKKRKP
jgi:hypothetical protein